MRKILILALSVLFVLCFLSCDGSVYSSVFDSSSDDTSGDNSKALSLEFIDAGNLTITINGYETSEVNLQYSLDNGSTKTDVTSGGSISVSAGGTVCIYGDRTADGSLSENGKHIIISCDTECYVYGNVMSLIDSDGFEDLTSIDYDYAFLALFANNAYIKNHATYDLVLPATTLSMGCYFSMFYGCSSLTEAPELPATTLADYCYYQMFSGCTGLTSAPSLAAETLTESCYRCMFYDCIGLTSAPELPATTLADYCYSSMFESCTGLESAPELPAETLAESCYSYMFYGCTNLNSITCLATDISASYCTYKWVSGVSGSGTFTRPASMSSTWSTDASGIPSDWTTLNYGLILNKTSTSIGAGGGAESLTATKNPSNITDSAVTWSSSNTNVATVADGTVTGVAAGTATITATAGSYSATCEVSVIDYNYSVGDTGPAGGKIFYVKDSYSDGWRYLEAAPADLAIIGSTPTVDSTATGYSAGTFVFGYYRPSGTNYYVNDSTTYNASNCTGTGIGTGKNNTELLVNKMGSAAYSRYSESDTTTTQYYAARMCSELSYGSYSDWFLPSKYELAQMYAQNSIIGCLTGNYWSSSEYSNAGYAWLQYFSDGTQSNIGRYYGGRVRPIRAF